MQILIADDHPLFRGALRHALSVVADDVEVNEAADLEGVDGDLARNRDTDLLLLDLAMPGMHGLAGLIYLRAQYPSVPVMIVSASEDHGVIRRCLDLGAAGFIPKTTDAASMRKAIRAVLDGGTWTPSDLDLGGADDAEASATARRLATLTPQQVRVLTMLSEGLLNKQIAYELSVSEATVKAHVSAILQKLGVESRTQAVIAAAKIEAGHWPASAGAPD